MVACFLAGMLLSRSLATDAKSSRISSSMFAIDLPAGWGETELIRAGGIGLSSSVAAGPLGGGGAGLVVGRVSDIVTLDKRFRAQGRRVEVRLGRLQAWRYDGLQPKAGVAATAYLAPTTGATLLVICHARRSEARTRLPECEKIAATIVLRGQRPASLARVSRHEERLALVMASLRRERLRGRQRLAEVELAADQARAARDLERSYREAAGRLEQPDTPTGTASLDDLVGSLRATAGAYAELADAAADADEAGYREAREAVVAAEKAVESDATVTAAA